MIENNNFEAENLQQQIKQSDYPLIDNFLQNGFSNDAKIIIDSIFNDNSDLKDSFESFLNTASLKDKMTCKKHLLSAETQDEIRSILMETIPGGCKIVGTIPDFSFDDVANDIQHSREEEQDSREEEQDSREEEQDSREEEQDSREEEQHSREEEQDSREEEQDSREEEQDSREEEQDSREEEQDSREEEQDSREEEQDSREEEQDKRDKINIVRRYEKAIDLRDRLLVKYPTLENDTKQGSKAYNDIKDLLQNNGTLDKLTDFGIDQDGYISLLATISVAQNNSEYQALRESQDFSLFYIAMKNLNNACNIPDTSFNSFSDNNISNTRTELFHETIGNKGLIEQRQRNIETHSSDYERLFSVESDDELIQNYGRFLDGDGRRLMEKRLSNPTSLSGDENDNLMNFVLFKQKEIEDKTKNMVEELCMTSQVKGFLSCIPKEYANQFQFNKANEIQVDQNGILQLNGHINGINFSLKQDTSDVNARLQTSTMLSKDQDNKFDFTGKYNNSPFILPTSSQVFDTALLSLQSEELSKIQNQDDYFDILQSSILKSMDKLYANTKYTQHYIDSQIKNDLVVNDVKNIIFNLGGTSLSKVGESDGKLYEFFDMIYFNLQSMTNHEKKKFCECLNKIGNIIRNEGHESGNDRLAKDEMLSRFLGSKDITTKILEKIMLTEDEKKSWSFFDFFKLFLSKSEINVDSLYKFLSNPNENGEDIWTKFDQINGTDTRNEYLDANLEAGLQEAFKL